MNHCFLIKLNHNKMYKGRWWEIESDGTIDIYEWDMFVDKKTFLEVMRDYMVQEGFYIRFISNESKRYTTHCWGENCT